MSKIIYRPFKDSAPNEALNEKGYVVVDFLNTDEVTTLRQFFSSGEEGLRTQFTTFATNNYQYKKLVHETITRVFERPVAELFSGYKAFWGNFFSKPGQSPAMPLHADFQYVREPEFISLNIWCPLVDTNRANGAFGVVPYSQNLVNQIRGTKITDAYRKNAKEIELGFGQILELPAGKAVIYEHRLLHYSLPNNTGEGRLAATMVMVPEGQELLHYYAAKEGDTTIYRYPVTSVDDFLKSEFQQAPQHIEPVEVINAYRFSPLGKDDFEAFYKQAAING